MDGIARYRHRYTEKSFHKMVRDAIVAEEHPDKDPWCFYTFTAKDSIGRLWDNVIIFHQKSGAVPPIINQKYEKDGFVVLRAILSEKKVSQITQFMCKLRDTKPQPNTVLRYVFRDSGKFDRIENFVTHFPSELTEISKLESLVKPIFGSEVSVFKDKINFKPPGSPSFFPHQDAGAGWGGGKQTTLGISLDSSNEKNGALHFVREKHKQGLLGNPFEPLPEDVVKTLKWEIEETETGDGILFDSYVPHFSEANNSNEDRKIVFVTYNSFKQNQKQLRDEYFAKKRKKQPTIDDDVDTTKLVRDSMGKWVLKDQ